MHLVFFKLKQEDKSCLKGMLWAHRLDALGAQTGCFGRTDWMFLVGLKAR